MKILDASSYSLAPHQVETSLLAAAQAGDNELYNELADAYQDAQRSNMDTLNVHEVTAQAIVSSIANMLNQPRVLAFHEAIGKGILTAYFFPEEK